MKKYHKECLQTYESTDIISLRTQRVSRVVYHIFVFEISRNRIFCLLYIINLSNNADLIFVIQFSVPEVFEGKFKLSRRIGRLIICPAYVERTLQYDELEEEVRGFNIKF